MSTYLQTSVNTSIIGRQTFFLTLHVIIENYKLVILQCIDILRNTIRIKMYTMWIL